ncbi:MAG: GtrA family protein [Muribaculaceae bacterium]|nr:GtrA family protein [Muribaculaceae bacterium]MBR5117520.1 GtrA family protein [Muribaculaceae bacterium]
MITKDETKKTIIQLMKYGVIGVMNTLITAISFYILNTLLSVPYGAANIIGYVLGVINSFIWNRQWVFKTGTNIKREALLFGCGFVICWLLQGGVSLLLLEGLGWKNLPVDTIPFLPMENAGQNIVMVISMVVYTIANYIYNRTITFKEKNKNQES